MVKCYFCKHAYDECYDVFLNNAAAMIDDLRARLEQAEKDNVELKRQLNSEVK